MRTKKESLYGKTNVGEHCDYLKLKETAEKNLGKHTLPHTSTKHQSICVEMKNWTKEKS